jgi:hypothetical protein
VVHITWPIWKSCTLSTNVLKLLNVRKKKNFNFRHAEEVNFQFAGTLGKIVKGRPSQSINNIHTVHKRAYIWL